MMNRIACASRRVFTALAAASLTTFAAGVASGQDLDVKLLELRVTKLESDAATQAVQRDEAKRQVDGDLTQIRGELTKLKADMTRVKADVAGLQEALAQLKKQEPGKPADGQSLTLRAPFTVKDGAGRVIFQVEVAAGRNLPRAIVGNPSGAHVEMGPASSGSAAVGLYGDSKNLLAALIGDPKGSSMRVRDDKQSASIGSSEGQGVGMFLRLGEARVVELSADKTGAGTVSIFGIGDKVAASLTSAADGGGTLKVLNKDAKAVAAVFAASDGGHVALTGPAGGKTAVGLSVTPTGGKVRVYPVEGGTARAELVAEADSGVVSIFNKSGTSAALLEAGQSGAGHLVILNAAGENVIEAGALGTGIGIIRAGPGGFGPAGSMGGALTPASSIQGRSAGK